MLWKKIAYAQLLRLVDHACEIGAAFGSLDNLYVTHDREIGWSRSLKAERLPNQACRLWVIRVRLALYVDLVPLADSANASSGMGH